MNPDSTHLERWIQIWIEKYATGSELKSSCERGLDSFIFKYSLKIAMKHYSNKVPSVQVAGKFQTKIPLSSRNARSIVSFYQQPCAEARQMCLRSTVFDVLKINLVVMSELPLVCVMHSKISDQQFRCLNIHPHAVGLLLMRV